MGNDPRNYSDPFGLEKLTTSLGDTSSGQSQYAQLLASLGIVPQWLADLTAMVDQMSTPLKPGGLSDTGIMYAHSGVGTDYERKKFQELLEELGLAFIGPPPPPDSSNSPIPDPWHDPDFIGPLGAPEHAYVGHMPAFSVGTAPLGWIGLDHEFVTVTDASGAIIASGGMRTAPGHGSTPWVTEFVPHFSDPGGPMTTMIPVEGTSASNVLNAMPASGTSTGIYVLDGVCSGVSAGIISAAQSGGTYQPSTTVPSFTKLDAIFGARRF